MGNTTKLQAPGPKCASYPVVGGKTNCPKDRCLFAGWFCAPLPTGHTVGSKADACEVQRTEDACARAGGDGMCRCTWGPNPVGKKHGKSEICAPRPAFGTPADTCTIPGAAAGADSTAPSCAKYTAKGTCPADRCIWGGWFCQPLPTGAEPDGTNTGACEKSRTKDSCSASGGDGECRCTWGVHPLGKKYKRPGGLICSPNPTFGTAKDTCTPPGYGSPPSDYDAAVEAEAPMAPAVLNPDEPRCATYKTKASCPKDRCIFGGWFCQPPATGAHLDGGNFGACEKVRSQEDCASTGGDGECRCTWGVHPLGKKYKRPGAKICSPNPEFLTRSDTCVPSDSPPGTLSPAAAAANAEEAGTDVPGGDGTDAQESVPAATSAPTQQCAGYQCDPKKWTGYVAKGGKICGECSAMVNIQVADGTCEGFCKLQGQTCVEGWEDMHLTRRHPYGHNVACEHGVAAHRRARDAAGVPRRRRL